MNKTLRWILIMVVTFAILIAIFWFIIPLTGFPQMIGQNAYWGVSLIGSFILSYFISRMLGKYIK